MGVNIDRVIAQTFILGGILGGAAGFLFGLSSGVVYSMGFTPALKAFTAAVLGGIGNIRGAMLGGLVLGVAENMGVICAPTEWRTSSPSASSSPSSSSGRRASSASGSGGPHERLGVDNAVAVPLGETER